VTRVFEVDGRRPDEFAEAVDAAVRATQAGGLVVFPTDTVYGIACRPDLPGATAAVFEAKRRPRGLSLPVLAASIDEALALGTADARAIRLARALWPGPLTIVLPRAERTRAWDLGDRAGSIAVRVPDHALSQAVLRAAGPLATTSANLSGGPPLSDRPGLLAAFRESVSVCVVDVAKAATEDTASTVVDLSGPDMRILRAGPIDQRRLEEAAQR